MTSPVATLSMDRDALVWNGEATDDVGITFVPAGTMSGWWADLWAPSVPVAWVYDPVDGLEVLEAVFGAKWRAAVQPFTEGGIEALVGVDPEALRPPCVSPEYARVAHVRSLREWYPEDIDEQVLRIDEALAWHAAGDAYRTRLALEVCASVLTQLAGELWAPVFDQGTEVSIPAIAHSDLEKAIDLAIEALDEDDDDRDVLLALKESAEGTVATSHVDWDAMLNAALRDAYGVAAHAGGEIAELEVMPLTPGSMTPRLLAWHGAEAPAIDAEPSDGVILVRAELAASSETYDREVRRLVAYACDSHTGDLLGEALLEGEPGSRYVAASVPLLREADAVTIGVREVDRDVRLDPAGRAIDRVNALGIGQWVAVLKAAAAAQVGATDAQARAHDKAADAADAAQFLANDDSIYLDEDARAEVAAHTAALAARAGVGLPAETLRVTIAQTLLTAGRSGLAV